MKDPKARKKFERTKWETAYDGLPKNPAAEKGCKTCKGHGVVDEGTILCMLVACSDCWNK